MRSNLYYCIQLPCSLIKGYQRPGAMLVFWGLGLGLELGGMGYGGRLVDDLGL